MTDSSPEARRWILAGRVQGVGFRPFVYRLAQRYELTGRVQNLNGQVLVEAVGTPARLDAFASALIAEAPPLAQPRMLAVTRIEDTGLDHFEIAPSDPSGSHRVHVPPDHFLCDDCRREMQDPRDRRYRYPFINCTQCGPRYTLITAMPYDRANTTMAGFALCDDCAREYRDPGNRRFHAEPCACPRCGPQLLFRQQGCEVGGPAVLEAAIVSLQRGDIVAIKGIGGYHLMCDAQNADAVNQLRLRKRRPHKPLAVMFPWGGEDGMECIRRHLVLDAGPEAVLATAARPIVLIPRSAASTLPDCLAPGLAELGAMLPYSPLHHLLLDGVGKPLVATSANISGEPVLIDAVEAEARLGQVADAFLHHDRPIARPADDPVVKVVAGVPRLLRAGRGVAPVEIQLPAALPRPVLAVGGHLKNTIALGWGQRAVMSPHIGDLDAPRSRAIFQQVIEDLQRLYGVTAQGVVCDAHAQYASSRWAASSGLPVLRVWHHHAHAGALALEHGPDDSWLVFAWDGLGLGEDGTLWGGEALLGRIGSWQRVARLRPFHLFGGESAAREPWRSAASLCWELGLDCAVPAADANLAKNAWQRRLNTPLTTAAGRLFDGAACLLGLCDVTTYEGQAPMLLEHAASGAARAVTLPLQEGPSGLVSADWEPLIRAMRNAETPVSGRAMQFHCSLARSIVDQAQWLRRNAHFDKVGLTGGVFQNRLLAELALVELRDAGFEALLPESIPCNDGGIALGQIVEAGYCHG
jgi:hydrogenase maturation protein HypF